MIDINHTVRPDEFPQGLLAHIGQGFCLHRSAADSTQNLVAVIQALRGAAIHIHRAFAVVGQGLVRQQAGHTQLGIAGQHTQLATQGGINPFATIDLGLQLIGHFIAQRIADNDKHAALIAFCQVGRHHFLVEVLLIDDTLQLPLLQQTILQMPIPMGGQLVQVAIEVGRLHLISQRGNGIREAGRHHIRCLVEQAIELINFEQRLGISGIRLLRASEAKMLGAGFNSLKQISRR